MKVAIIGGGVCGLYLSWKLAERGEEVTIFEKKGGFGQKACSGLFSERILEFIPQSQSLIQNKIKYCLIHLPQKTIKLSFSKNFFVMERSKLDELLANLAVKENVEIFLNSKLDNLPQNFDKIIGCDGANSFVREKLTDKKPEFKLAIQGFLKKEDWADVVETWPTENGFLWKIPRGKEIEYGVMEKIKIAPKIFNQFLEKNNLSLENIKSAIIPQGFVIYSDEKITLCGDAVGLTKPWSGGGVVWSLIAANLLLKNFPDFIKYKKELKKFFLPRILFSKVATKIFYFLGFKTPFLLPKNYKIESDFIW
jgi:flavin-dependent dehydrogenase